MSVIVLASPKGGVGKSTATVLLATEFAKIGADVTVLDCDPNQSVCRWAKKKCPERIVVKGGVTSKDMISMIRNADGDGKIVLVDLEGTASQMVTRAVSQADLVIVPMQPTSLDAEIGATALSLIHEEEETFRRSIAHAVVLTKTSAAIKTRVQIELEKDLKDSKVDIIEPSLVNRQAFAELFAFGGDLYMMLDQKRATAGNIETAIENSKKFMEAVYERLRRISA